MDSELEESAVLKLDFQKIRKICERTREDVLPVVVQDDVTREVLVLAYANEYALKYSLSNGVAAFWSTSRNELWVKGLTSGNMLKLMEVRVNCEQNSLLYIVEMDKRGGACHTNDSEGRYRQSCYYRKISADGTVLQKITKKGDGND